MLKHLLVASLMAVEVPALASAQITNQPVASESQLEFHSDLLMNLHHTLYGAAWSRRPEAGTLRALAGPLPSPLDAPMRKEDQTAWDAAVDYYDKQVASRDLLFGRGMRELKVALVAGDLSREAVGDDLRRVLESVTPVYRKHFWPAHDRANRAWIEHTVEGVRTIAPDVIERLTKLYAKPWFTSPVRIDVVWVANRQGAYATDGPTHATISSGAANNTGWSAVEIVFHEISHILIEPIQKRLADALGASLRDHGVLWHVVQFYVTGQVVRDVLATRGIAYSPYMYSTGLFDRAWSRYRATVERNWRPYVDGRITVEQAVAGTVKELSGG
jgi:hypothetical protein